MARLNKDNAAAPLENDPEPVTPATLPAKRKRGRPSKTPQSSNAGSKASKYPVLPCSRSSADHRLIGDSGSGIQGLRRSNNPFGVHPEEAWTASQGPEKAIKEIPSPRGPAASAEEVKEMLVAVKHLVGYQHLPDEDFMDHLKGSKPNVLGDLLSVKHQLHTTFHNQSDSANGPRTRRNSAAAQVTTAPDNVQPAVPASNEAATRSEQGPIDAETTSGRVDEKAEPAT
ncbi:MAG: hypothetical protein Q9193_002484 [Seirophora villosa]